MNVDVAGRIALLEAVAAKGEKALARQRGLIEELRADGHRTADLEDVLQRYEASHRALLEKLAILRHETTNAYGHMPVQEFGVFARGWSEIPKMKSQG